VQDEPVWVLALWGLAVTAPGVVNVDVDTHGCGGGLVVEDWGSSSVSQAQLSKFLVRRSASAEFRSAMPSLCTSHITH